MTPNDLTPNDPAPPGDPSDDPIVVRSLRELLVRELQHRVPSEDGEVMQSQLIEHRLVRMAMDGNLAAIKEIHDRCDGKVPIAPKLPQPPRRVTVAWLDRQAEDCQPEDCDAASA
jgi:hypothetical protein